MKMKAFLFVPALCLLMLLCGCFGDPLRLESGIPANLTVEEITKRMQRATDPEKHYANAKSYYMKQRLTTNNENGNDESISEIFWRAPNFLKQVSYRNGEVINIIIAKGNRFWYVNPKNKKSREITGKDAQLVKAFTDITTPGLNYQNIFHSVTVDQIRDPKSDRMVYRLICRVDNPDIAPYVFYVDPKTWLTDRCETILYSPNGSRHHYVADSEEYEMASGVRIAKKTLVTVDRKKDTAETIAFTLNPEIPLSTFDLERPWNH